MSAIEILNQLAKGDIQAKYPSVPQHALPKFNYSDKDSSGLTKSIIDFLTLKGQYAVRINTQGQYNEGLKVWTKSTTRLGTADIHACIKGKHVSIEVKIGKDKLSEDQIETMASVVKADGLYFVAKSFESFYLWYNEIESSLSKEKRKEAVAV